MSVCYNSKHLEQFVKDSEFAALYPQVETAHRLLETKTGPGNDFLGWVSLPKDYDKEEFARIKAAAARIREDSDVLVVIGIGGSYLGARAVIEAVKGQMYNCTVKNGPQIFFVGNSISPAYFQDILDCRKGKRISRNIISQDAGVAGGGLTGQEAHLRHHRPGPRHPEAAGRGRRLGDVCGARRCGRPVLGAHRSGPAAHRLRRLRH